MNSDIEVILHNDGDKGLILLSYIFTTKRDKVG